MKKIIYTVIIMIIIGAMLQGCSTDYNRMDKSNSLENLEDNTIESKVTKEMAYEGINNYCHSEYDWSITEDNPEIMYVEMGEESDTEYQVKFRSYTGAFVYFYVNKLNGTTRMIEYVPTLNVENEIGTINLYDYLND